VRSRWDSFLLRHFICVLTLYLKQDCWVIRWRIIIEVALGLVLTYLDTLYALTLS
jgi:hypothetical protein